MIDATNSPIERIRVLTSDIFSEESVVDDHRGGPGVDVHTLLDAPDIIHLLDHFIHTSLQSEQVYVHFPKTKFELDEFDKVEWKLIIKYCLNSFICSVFYLDCIPTPILYPSFHKVL